MGYLFNEEDNSYEYVEENIGVIPQIVWHITDKCLLSCQYCFATKTQEEVIWGDMEQYVERFKELGIQKIDISGGEPLLYKNLPQLCYRLKENNISITITTKGVGTKDNLEWLINNVKYFTRIICSLDVSDGMLQDRICNYNNTTDSIEYILKSFQDTQYKNYRINTVVTKYLLNDEILDQLISKVLEYDCAEWCLIEPHPANKKITFNDLSVSKQEFEKITYKIKKKYNKKNIIRKVENFNGYWVLYPNKLFIKHGYEKSKAMDFIREPMNKIIKEIGESDLWIQMKK